MKRVLLFLAIFLSGITLLVLVLGPDSLFRDLAQTDLTAAETTFDTDARIKIHTEGGAVSLEGSDYLEYPVTKEIRAADGTEQVVEIGRMVLREVRPLENGIRAGPTELLLHEQGRPKARITSDSSASKTSYLAFRDLNRRSSPSKAPRDRPRNERQKKNAEADGRAQIYEIHLAGNVLAELLRPDGSVALQLFTRELTLPVQPLPGQRPEDLEPVRTEQPIRLIDPEGTLEVNGQGLEIHRNRSTVRVAGPVEVRLQDLDPERLFGAAAAEPEDEAPEPREVETPEAASEPVVVTSSGDLFYRRQDAPPEEEGEEEGAKAGADSGEDSGLDLAELLGSGTLTFAREVEVHQGDQSLIAELLRLDIEQVEEEPEEGDPPAGSSAEDAAPRTRFRVTSVTAGDGVLPVEYGVMGGRGTSHLFEWSEDDLVLQGPVNLQDLQIEVGEGDTRSLHLQAATQLTVSPLEAAAVGEEPDTDPEGSPGPPALRRIVLERNAAFVLSGWVQAEGTERVEVWLRKRPSPPAPEGEGEGEDPAAPAEESAAPGFDLVRLLLRGSAELVFEEAALEGRRPPRFEAETIDVWAVPGGGWSVELTAAEEGGPATVQLEQAWFQGPRIELGLDPDDPESATVEVPELGLAWFETPEVFSLTSTSATEPGAAKDPVPVRLLLIPVRGTCDFQLGPEGIAVTGRAAYTVFRGDPELRLQNREQRQTEVDLQRLDCDQLDLALEAGRLDRFAAQGAVDFEDFESGARILSDSVSRTSAGRWVELTGRPAFARIPQEATEPVEIEGEVIRFDPETQEFAAHSEPSLLLREGLATTRDPALLERRASVRLDESLLPADFWARKPTPSVPEEGAAADAAEISAGGDAEPAPDSGPSLAEVRAFEVEYLAGSVEEGGTEEKKGAGRIRAKGALTVTRESDGAALSGTELVLDEGGGTVRLDGDPAGGWPAFASRPKPYDLDRVESVTGDWIELRNRGQEMDLSPGALLVLHPEGSWDPEEDAGKIPDFRRIELVAGGPADLRDHPSDPTAQILRFRGGVESKVDFGKDQASAKTADISSDRLEVVLDAKTREARGLYAQQLFRLRHPRFACEGGTLSLDFATGWLHLKASAEPCRFSSAAAERPGVKSEFQDLRFHLEREALEVRPVDLFVEVDRDR